MGSPSTARVPTWQDKVSCFFSTPLNRNKTQTSKWQRAQDPRKPRRVAQTFLPCSHKGKSKFKEAFGIMDCDKNGLLSEDGLVSAFAAVGKSISSGEASNMLSESPGPVNFTQMVTLFAEKMAGGTDDDDTILKSFDAFEINGKIDAEMFKHSLMTWGDKFTDTEVDEAFAEFTIEDGQIDAAHLKSLMVAKKEGEEEA